MPEEKQVQQQPMMYAPPQMPMQPAPAPAGPAPAAPAALVQPSDSFNQHF